MSLIDGIRRVLLVHAHPDDETIATGGLIAELRSRGVDVGVLTATRGERGEIAQGPLRDTIRPGELSAVRERELADALSRLDVRWHAYLGQGSARASGRGERRYEDSGMRWVTPELAGPAEDSTPDCLTRAGIDEVAADIGAAVSAFGPDLLITYDEGGGYGHPDHVHCWEATARAAAATGTPLALLVTDESSVPQDAERVGGVQHLPTVISALRAHATQLTVDGHDLVHSGGQRQEIPTSSLLRRP